jgi:hypothetical protein
VVPFSAYTKSWLRDLGSPAIDSESITGGCFRPAGQSIFRIFYLYCLMGYSLFRFKVAGVALHLTNVSRRVLRVHAGTTASFEPEFTCLSVLPGRRQFRAGVKSGRALSADSAQNVFT